MQVIRRQPTIGAEIRGVDLATPLEDDIFAEIYAALLRYKVIYFRDQALDADSQIGLGNRFGPLEVNPFRPQGRDAPVLQIVRNDRDNPVFTTDVWHADLTFRAMPTKFTILRCVEMPACGGDTLWADMCAAYDGLDAELQDRITGLEAVHDFKNFRALYEGKPERAAELAELEAMFPQPTHPVVATHPETGQRVLFVNRQFTVSICDMPAAESAALLELLYAQASVPEYQFRLEWEPGTVAIWDNRSTQHYAVNDYYPALRHMERVAVAGDAEPVFDPRARLASGYPRLERVHAQP